MKAAVYYENGTPDVLKYEDVPDPVCHPKGVVLRVEAVSIEGGDTLNRWHGALSSKPHIVGYQAGGEIIEVGSDENLRVGQKVATCFNSGSHAALRAVLARNAWLVPDGFDVKLASVIPVTFGTAHDCLFELRQAQGGRDGPRAGGSEWCKSPAIQLAKRAGATVIATASSDDRLERLKRSGWITESTTAVTMSRNR